MFLSQLIHTVTVCYTLPIVNLCFHTSYFISPTCLLSFQGYLKHVANCSYSTERCSYSPYNRTAMYFILHEILHGRAICFIEGLRYLLNTTFMSSQASREIFLDIYPPENLVHRTCLKMAVLHHVMRDVLAHVGISVEQRQGMYIPQAIVNAM